MNVKPRSNVVRISICNKLFSKPPVVLCLAIDILKRLGKYIEGGN